jgi:hypothetical protein
VTPSKKSLQAAGLAAGAALALSAGPSGAQPMAPPSAPTTRILAIGHMTPKFNPQSLRTVLPEEVRDTVRLYLQGKISDWYARNDRPGVVFVLNTADVKEAERMMAALPFGRDGLLDFELIPVGPLAPLGVLLNGPAS